MSARIFISYRSADGADKATALARDLGRVFGAGNVFLDKDDLRGGSAWRAEIGHALQQRPVLLLLMTPQLFGAQGADGRRRIDDPEDPVRRELADALAAGATVIPLLTDDLPAPPAPATLPPPFDRLGDFTWRKLRAYDWAADVQRLVEDLRAAGLPASRRLPRRGTLWIVAAALGLAGLTLWRWRSTRPQTLDGRWRGSFWAREAVVLQFEQQGDKIRFTSEPVPIAQRADWAEYRAFWKERVKADLDAIVYRGEGLLHRDPGQSPRVDIALEIHPAGLDEKIDGGNFSAKLSADGRVLDGTIWRNGAQAEQAARLTR